MARYFSSQLVEGINLVKPRKNSWDIQVITKSHRVSAMAQTDK
jgi:hypothetical protein